MNFSAQTRNLILNEHERPALPVNAGRFAAEANRGAGQSAPFSEMRQKAARSLCNYSASLLELHSSSGQAGYTSPVNVRGRQVGRLNRCNFSAPSKFTADFLLGWELSGKISCSSLSSDNPRLPGRRPLKKTPDFCRTLHQHLSSAIFSTALTYSHCINRFARCNGIPMGLFLLSCHAFTGITFQDRFRRV